MTLNVSGRVYGTPANQSPRHQELAVNAQGFLLTSPAPSAFGDVLSTQDLRFKSTAPAYQYAQRLTLRSTLGVVSYQYLNAAGVAFVPSPGQLADLEPVNGEQELELKVTTYKATVDSLGITAGDIVQGVDRFDLLAGGIFSGTLWTNLSTGAVGIAAPDLLTLLSQGDQTSPDVVEQLVKNRLGLSVPLFFRAQNVGIGYVIGDRIALINFFDPSTTLRTLTRAYNITVDPRMLVPLSSLPPSIDLGRDAEPVSTNSSLVRLDWQRNNPANYYQIAVTLPAGVSTQIFPNRPTRSSAGLQVVQQINPSDVVISYGTPVVVNLPNPNYRVAIGGAYGALNVADENFTTAAIHAWCAEPTIIMLYEGTL
jgi:hypothetical protein